MEDEVKTLRQIAKRKKIAEKEKESEEHYRIFASYQHAISELRKFYIVNASFEQMIQKTLDLIIEKFGYYMAWYAELIEKEKVILPKLWAGKYEKYLDGLRLEYENDKRDAKCAMSIAILTKKPFGYADIEHDKDFEKWRAFALQYGYRSNQAIPFIVNGRRKSAFLIYSTRPYAFSEKLIEYLRGIVDELAMIIENIIKRKEAEKALRKAHDELEMRVKERTAELAKINEALRVEITEHKKAEETLRESEEKFRTLAEQSPNMIFIYKKDRIVYVNKKCEEVVGHKKKKFYSSGFDFFTLIAPEFVDVVKETLNAYSKNREVPTHEFTLITKESKRVDVISTPKLITYEGKSAILGVVTDITERKKAEKALKLSGLELQQQKLALEQKNTALKEVIGQIEIEKNKIKDDIVINVNELILPILKKLRIKGTPGKYIDLLQRHLAELTSSFGRKITEKSIKLTPREIEICSMIKGSLTSKELSKLLNISHQTVEKHRKNIRKKLSISNKNINLTSFLQRI